MGLTKLHLPRDAINLLRLMSFISAEGLERSFIIDYFENNGDSSDEALLVLRQATLLYSTFWRFNYRNLENITGGHKKLLAANIFK